MSSMLSAMQREYVHCFVVFVYAKRRPTLIVFVHCSLSRVSLRGRGSGTILFYI